MFAKAVPAAAQFTRPLVLSSRTANGECQCTIGTYVVLNEEGWILTAGHLLDIVRRHRASALRPARVAGAEDRRRRLRGARVEARGQRRDGP